MTIPDASYCSARTRSLTLSTTAGGMMPVACARAPRDKAVIEDDQLPQ